MNILMIAPQPFYQDRGTPIAVNMILRILSERDDKVDLITFPEGKNIYHKNLSIYRTPKVSFVKNIRPGFSWKKIICDLLIFPLAINLVLKNKYHLVHAVEESVFIALLIKLAFNIPYIYDMDSSLSQQMIEKYPWLSVIDFIFNFLEGIAIKNAKAVVPVCEALAIDIRKYHPKKIFVIPDTSLIESFPSDETGAKKCVI